MLVEDWRSGRGEREMGLKVKNGIREAGGERDEFEGLRRE